ncbi:hypothetical protein P7C71_g2524, partial [Lecanoromycetidae sp. Uapishka_2]
MSSCNWMVILGADLKSSEQVQEIADLPFPPERVDVSKVDDDDEDQEEDDGEEEGEEDAADMKTNSEDDEEAGEEGEEAVQCGCWIDNATKTSLLEWAKKEQKLIKPIFMVKRPASTINALRTYPVPYFFYGTLADPEFLRDKLGIDEVPELKKGLIKGWRVQMAGKFKALVKACGEEVVEGSVYMVRSEEEVGKLAAWEGSNYRVERCEIVYEDGGKVEGNVFVFCGNGQYLRDVPEGGLGLAAEISALRV